jgi:hypothetical protein
MKLKMGSKQRVCKKSVLMLLLFSALKNKAGNNNESK